MPKTLRCLLLTIGACAGTILPAHADVINVFENGEAGFTVNTSGPNTRIGSMCTVEACAVIVAATNPSWQADFIPATFDVTEPDGTTVGDYVDVFSFGGSPFYGIMFQSDTGETGLPSRGLVAVDITETGQPQTLPLTVTWTENGAVVGTDTIRIQSDLDAVPEPSPVVLLLTCVVALAFLTRRTIVVARRS